MESKSYNIKQSELKRVVTLTPKLEIQCKKGVYFIRLKLIFWLFCSNC